MTADQVPRIVEELRTGFEHLLGYDPQLIRSNYSYDRPASGGSGRVDVACFSQHPPSYRSACIGVVAGTDAQANEPPAEHWELGAPIIIRIGAGIAVPWRMRERDGDRLSDPRSARAVGRLLAEHRADWSPARVAAAKTGLAQLDFMDAGLLPVLEGHVRAKLDGWITSAMQEVRSLLHGEEVDWAHVVFPLLAAKLLRDLGYSDAHQNDPFELWQLMRQRYGGVPYPLSPALQDACGLVWQDLERRGALNNTAVEDLAYIYENTLIDAENRRQRGIHATPPSVAQYIVGQLPFESVAVDERSVFEPCCGQGAFLVPALGRLRDIHLAETGVPATHQYLVDRLVGVDIDGFSLELCRLGLTLSALPGHDGWHLHTEDVFRGANLQDQLAAASIVLCNPPFGKFDADEQRDLGVGPVSKAAELLSRVLVNPPALLGFVLPSAFIQAAAFRDANQTLGRRYNALEIVRLSDRVFPHADSEPVLLMASELRASGVTNKVRCVEARTAAAWAGLKAGAPADFTIRPVPPPRSVDGLWRSPLADVWEYLESKCARLKDIAVIRRGVQVTGGREFGSIRDEPFGGSIPCHRSAGPDHAGYSPPAPGFMPNEPGIVNVGSLDWDWPAPKAVANKHSASRGPWRLYAWTDYSGAVCWQAFYALWPLGDMPAEVLTAILNGPVANAFLAGIEDKRHNLLRSLQQIPVPDLSTVADRLLIARKVAQIEELAVAGEVLANAAYVQRLIDEVDAAVLSAYDLPQEHCDSLLNRVHGQIRRLPNGRTPYTPPTAAVIERVQRQRGYTAALVRYQQLVDAKWRNGLSSDEESELGTLSAGLDAMEEAGVWQDPAGASS